MRFLPLEWCLGLAASISQIQLDEFIRHCSGGQYTQVGEEQGYEARRRVVA